VYHVKWMVDLLCVLCVTGLAWHVQGDDVEVGEEEMEEQQVEFHQVEQRLEGSGEEEEGEKEEVEEGRRRKVRFRTGKALVSEFDDTNLWAHGQSLVYL